MTATVPLAPEIAGSALPCRAASDDLWFSDDPADLEQAKALCVGCPVRPDCLAGAVARREYCGVWGGEIFERGAPVPRKRPRGRPRKADLARDAERAAALAAAVADLARPADAAVA